MAALTLSASCPLSMALCGSWGSLSTGSTYSLLLILRAGTVPGTEWRCWGVRLVLKTLSTGCPGSAQCANTAAGEMKECVLFFFITSWKSGLDHSISLRWSVEIFRSLSTFQQAFSTSAKFFFLFPVIPPAAETKNAREGRVVCVAGERVYEARMQ